MAKTKAVRDSLESLPLFTYSTSRQLSGNTVERYRSPTNPRTANAMTQYVFDHSVNPSVTPTGTNGNVKYGTINRDGESAAHGALAKAFIGGVPNQDGFQAKYFRSK